MHSLPARFFLTLLLLLCASTLNADTGFGISANPMNWFSRDGGQQLTLEQKRAAEEEVAAQLLASGKAELEAGRTRSAMGTFKDIAKDYGEVPSAAEARFLTGRILMTRGKWTKAFNVFQEIVDENPDYEEYNEVIAAQFECATALMEGARGRILFVLPGFKQYDEAVLQFEKIVQNGPYSDYAPLSLMNIALVAEKTDEPDVAIDALDRLINYYPQSMLAPDAYFNMAKTYANLVKGYEYDQGATRQAVSYYEDFLILFPESNYLGEVEANLAAIQNLLAENRLNLGNFYYFYRSNNTAALVFYKEAVTIAPESEAAEEARERIEDIEAGVRPVSGARLVRNLLFID